MAKAPTEKVQASDVRFVTPAQDREIAEPPLTLPYSQGFEPETPKVPFSHYLWILRRHAWKLATFVAALMLLTFVISARQKRIYESTATIDIDFQAPTSVVGQNSSSSSYYLDPDVFLTTQIRLIQSDSVLRPVAERFHLLGDADKQSNSDTSQVQKLVSAPISLGGLRVTRPVNTYLLLVSYRSSSPQQAADIANAVAQSYLTQTYERRIRSSDNLSSFMSRQLDTLKAKMEQSGQALAQFEKDTDVINPEEKTDILSSRLMQLNTAYTAAQADRVQKEAIWNSMKSGSMDAALISPQGQSLDRLATAMNDAQQQLAQVKATYGDRHPEYRKAAAAVSEIEQQTEATRHSLIQQAEMQYQQSLNQEQLLAKAVADAKAEWDAINARSFQYQQLKQEATADKSLYDELTRKIREEGINTGFKDNDIRIADPARPSPTPVFPNIQRNVLMSLFFSTLLGLGAIFALDSLDTTLRDPAEASRFLHTDVIGTLPVDRSLSEIATASKSETNGTGPLSPISNASGDKGYRSISGFEEAVRTIRNTILLSDFEQRLRSIVLTSAEPGEGKTTLAVHLAIANADRGKKTLLVDADLRRPSIHARFGLSPSEGLSNVLNGELAWQDATIPIDGRPNLAILSAGPGSHRAADLIGPHLAELLDDFAKQYDLVILDSPPLLGFAECLQMADAADGVLIVTRAGETKRKSVASVVSTLQRLRANIVGIVLNQVTKATSEGGYSYYGRHYYDYNDKSEA